MDETVLILQELMKRAESNYHKYQPQPKQLDFHQSLAQIRLLFGGNQSGKSRGSAQEIAFWFSHAHPYRVIPDRPIKIWVISTEYQTIREGVYSHLKRILPEWEIDTWGPRVQGHDLHSYVKSKRGDEIFFLSAKGGEDSRTKFQAAAVDLIIIDEEIEDYIWEELQVRLLATGGSIVISATLVESYQWIVDLEERGDMGDPDVFLKRLHTDENPYLNKEYVGKLKGRLDDDTLRYRFYGKSRRTSGLVYKGFRQTHKITPFTIPSIWPRWHVYDPGFRTSAAIWAALTPHNQAIFYRIYYAHNVELVDVLPDFIELEKNETVDIRIIDDKSESRTVTGQIGPLTQAAIDYQRFYTPAMKNKHAGIEETRKWLKIDEDPDFHEYKLDNDEVIKLPKSHSFFIFNVDTSIPFFKEITKYSIKQARSVINRNEPVDMPVKAQDHLMDCMRYLFVTRPQFFIRSGQRKKENMEKLGTLSSMSLEERHERHLEWKKRNMERAYEFAG
jgi:hypothetical protein